MRYLLLALLLTGCGTAPVREPAFSGWHKNACVPEAAAMVQGLNAAGIQSRVLLIYTPAWNHAVAVYLYPAGANRLWVWDENWKSVRVRAWWDAPAGIARAWLAETGRTATVTSADFLE
ncbi:MAG: hypothetical protein WCQ16_02780 [Verrucomicrobiae bacterium]